MNLEHLLIYEKRMENIVQPTNRMLPKLQTLEMVYFMLWAEILSLLAAHSHISVKHKLLFEFACNLKQQVAAKVNQSSLTRESLFPHDDRSRESPIEMSVNLFQQKLQQTSRSATNSPAPIKKMRLTGALAQSGGSDADSSFAKTTARVNLHPGGESFLKIVSDAVTNKRKPKEFIRRLPEGRVADLYVGFDERAAKLSKDV